jgi:hypothetical protein
MLKSTLALIAAALLLGACDSPPPQAAAPPPPPPAPPPVFMVFFDMGSSTLSAQAQGTVQQAAAAFKSRGGARITATGHTDTVGSDQFNMVLSLRRANSVKASLVTNGVPADAIATVGRGEQGLLVQTGDGVAEPQNRRVEIALQVPATASNDAAYCKALSDKWRAFSKSQSQGPQAEAMNQCAQGNYAAGIPVLEKALTDDKIPLPPRT